MEYYHFITIFKNAKLHLKKRLPYLHLLLYKIHITSFNALPYIMMNDCFLSGVLMKMVINIIMHPFIMGLKMKFVITIIPFLVRDMKKIKSLLWTKSYFWFFLNYVRWFSESHFVTMDYHEILENNFEAKNCMVVYYHKSRIH